MTATAILLAAGASRRMGSPKPLLDWGGQPLVIAELGTLEAAGIEDPIVVLGAHAQAVRHALGARARLTVFNAQWPSGRATSLATGAATLLRRAQRPEAVIVQNVDQPTRPEILQRLLEELAGGDAEAVQPERDGHGGHPVVLRGSLLEALAAADEASEGLRGVLAAHPPQRVPIDDPIVRIDLDTPDDLERARTEIGVTA